MLIPRYGALGAAIGTCCALLIHNVLKQTGLLFGTGISLFEWRYAKVYATIVGIAAALWAVQAATAVPAPVSLALAAVASLGVFRLNRHLLDVDNTFPELMRIPLVRKLIAGKRAAGET